MTKFTGDISDVSGPKTGSTSGSTFVQNKGGTANVLASLFQAGAGQAVEASKERKRLEAGKAIGDAQTSILDLQDERNRAIQTDIDVQNTIQNIEADGTITPEEQETLNALEGKKKFLQEARKSGVLNDTAFQTRINSMHRQSLAAVSNLGIQNQINQIFIQGRSQISSGTPRAQLEFNASMDKKYGAGNWTAEQAGKERAAALFNAKATEQAQIEITSMQVNAPQVFSNMVDGALVNLTSSINENGALLPDQTDLYRASVIQQFTVANKQINDIVKNIQADPSKRLTPEQLESVNKAREQIRTQRDQYLSLLGTGDGKLGEAAVAKRIKRYADLKANTDKLQNPQLTSAVLSGAASGKGSLVEWAGVMNNDQVLTTVINHLPEAMRGGMTVDTLRGQIAQAVQASLQPGVTLQDMVEMGVVNKPLARILAVKGVKGIDSPEEVSSVLSVFKQYDATNFNDTAKALIHPAEMSKWKSLEGPTRAKAQKEFQDMFGNYAEGIAGDLEGISELKITRGEGGKFVLSAPPRSAGQVPLVRERPELTNKVNTFLQLVNQYKDFTGLTPEEASQKLLAKPFEVSSGSGVEEADG